MSYFIQIDSDKRIAAYCKDVNCLANAIEVESLPKGDVGDYLYVNGEYINSSIQPIPVPTEPEQMQAQILFTAVMTDTLIEGV